MADVMKQVPGWHKRPEHQDEDQQLTKALLMKSLFSCLGHNSRL